MSKETEHEAMVENLWRIYLTTGEPPGYREIYPYTYQQLRSVLRRLPKDPRCQLCLAPFSGIGGTLARTLLGKEPSRLNPTVCNVCEQFARKHQGGAEVELSMLFADVRGSTPMAEGMRPAEYSQVIARFYKVSTGVLIHSNALIEKMHGDQVTGLYVPGLAGPEYSRVAVEAAEDILRTTGHGDPNGPWVPVGCGVHTGIAFVGAVGSEDGLVDIAALGDAVNTAARLASQAAPGEVIISEETCRAAKLDTSKMEARSLQLKGRSEPVSVRIIRMAPTQTVLSS
jgi:adenylate cyclase